MLEGTSLKVFLGTPDGLVLGTDEGIILDSTDGELICSTLVATDAFTFGLDEGTEIGSSDGSFCSPHGRTVLISSDGVLEGTIYGILEVSTFGISLGSTDAEALKFC